MYEAIAMLLPKKLVKACFVRIVGHCKNSADPEVRNDARYTDNTLAQLDRVISGEVVE